MTGAPGRWGAAGRIRRGALPVAAAATFVAFLDVFALLPTIAPAARALDADDLAIGFVVAAYSVGGLPGNVLGGALADRFGRAVTATVGLLGAGLALATYALAGSVGALLVARVAHGFAGGIAMPALFAAASDAVGRGRGGGAMGRLGATIGIAAIIGPATAGSVSAAVGVEAVFVGVAVLLVGGAGLAWRLPRPGAAPAAGARAREPATALAPDAGSTGEEAVPPPEAVRHAMGAALATIFGFTVALGVLTGYLPDAVLARGGGAALTGVLLTGFSVLAVAVMLSPAVRRLRADALAAPLLGGLLVIALALALLGATATLIAAAVAVLAVGLGFGVLFPASATAMTVVGVERRGRAFGRFHVAYGTGLIVGAPLSAGLGEALAVSPFVPAAGVTALVAALVGLLLRRGAVERRRAVGQHAR